MTRDRVAVGSVALLAMLLASCGGDDGADKASSDTPLPPVPGSNRAPTISGSPPQSILAGAAFDLQPAVFDADGDSLVFSVHNLPPWATFDSTTGRLHGTPTSADVGIYADILINVSDGRVTSSLPRFTIRVVATAVGSATLNWTPPTQRSDGSPLTNLAGFKVYWGTHQGVYPNSVTIDSPGITSYVLDQLTPATWFFVMTAIDSNGVESEFSNIASKTVL